MPLQHLRQWSCVTHVISIEKVERVVFGLQCTEHKDSTQSDFPP